MFARFLITAPAIVLVAALGATSAQAGGIVLNFPTLTWPDAVSAPQPETPPVASQSCVDLTVVNGVDCPEQ
jgi:hypothetical protein